MKLNHPIKIDMFDFFCTGRFDYIELGQTKEWILNNFADPDNYSGKSSLSADIWCYGSIEFYFTDNQLYMIFCDNFICDNGDWHTNKCTSLTINPWILADSSELTLIKTQQILNNHHIDYQKISNELTITLILSSGVHLGFSKDKDEININNLTLNCWYFK